MHLHVHEIIMIIKFLHLVSNLTANYDYEASMRPNKLLAQRLSYLTLNDTKMRMTGLMYNN